MSGDTRGSDIPDQPPRLLSIERQAESGAWMQDVLNNTMTVSTPLAVPAGGTHTLRVYMVDPGVVLDKLVLDLGGLKDGYLGPPETRQ